MAFRDAKELRKVFDLLFSILSADAALGPRLRALRKPQRIVFTDLGATLDVGFTDDRKAARGDHLDWRWGGKAPWKPDVTLETTSEVANRYFQGKENIPMALARGRIVITDGSPSTILETLPIILPFHKTWVRRVEAEGWDHLLA